MAKVSSTPAPAPAAAPSGGGMAITASAAPESAPVHEEGSAYSTEDVMKLFEGGEEPEIEDDGVEVVETDPVEDEGQSDEESPKVEAPEYPMPDGWEEAMWQGAPVELRGKVDSMVKAHAEALSAKEKAMQDAAARHLQEQTRANAEMQTSLNLIRQVTEGEFVNVDWNALAHENPALYVEAQQLYNQRMQAIQQMQARVQAHAQQLAQVRAQEFKAAMDADFAATLPKIQALVGNGFEKKAFGQELAAYLGKAGVPREHIGNITRGYELELATKAMLFDKYLEARQAATAKVAEAPKVQAPHGAKSADDGDRLKSARARLIKNPDSTEALAALFAAM